MIGYLKNISKSCRGESEKIIIIIILNSIKYVIGI